jgi:hypothetical protein
MFVTILIRSIPLAERRMWQTRPKPALSPDLVSAGQWERL